MVIYMERISSDLFELMQKYSENGVCPMHMPGHKRNGSLLSDALPWHLDVTEVGDFDNLHMPKGILVGCQEKAARLWGSGQAYYLVSGSTSGILAGIYAGTSRGDKILVARNCHKSVYHAIEICGLVPVYINSTILQTCGICAAVIAKEVERALNRHPDIRLAVITSPTYEGIISDISAISKVLHTRNIPLFVDEAHGAHLGISDCFPKSSIQCGADIAVNSLHKTLPSLTQTAMLHIQGELIDGERVRHALSIFQTSSPSYILMESIDSCVSLLAENGVKLLYEAKCRLDKFYAEMSKLEQLKILSVPERSDNIFAFDFSKVLIITSDAGVTGPWLMEYLLKEHKIQLEMASGDYALAMTSLCDTDENMERLAYALNDADERCGSSVRDEAESLPYPELEQRVSAGDTMDMAGEYVPFDISSGRISGEYIWAYPPGIPLVTPGAVITSEIVATAVRLEGKGVSISSTSDKMPCEIRVLSENPEN